MVTGVSEASPAASELSEGARIVEANGHRMADPYDFENVLLGLRPGDDVELVLEGMSRPVRFSVGEPPSMSASAVSFEGLMDLVTVTPAIQVERGLARGEGALVTSIDRRLQSILRLTEDDVIHRINRTNISTAEQAIRMLSRVTGLVELIYERNGEYFIRRFRI